MSTAIEQQNDQYVTIPAATRSLPVPVDAATVRRWATVGLIGRKLPSMVVGNRRYVRVSDLQAFVRTEN